MSSSQLDDIYEQKRARAIAQRLGISYDELLETAYTLDDNESNDGLIYNHIVRFQESSPKHILDKIEGLQNYTVNIELFDEESDE